MSSEQADESDIEHVEEQGAYALVVRGNSMIEDHIRDKDYVVIKPQSTCENGDIVVAVHLLPPGEGQATLKRFYLEQEQGRVRLQPANSELDPIFIPLSEWEREWQIQGKVVAIFRKMV
jgi:repressor LexA